LGKILRQPGTTLFEGAQGVLLDEWWGFYPYNSWSTLTYKNADVLLDENDFYGARFKLGLIRAYATRHGAGPFVSEDAELSASMQDTHNRDNPWQQAFRVGWLDVLVLRYALAVTDNIDGLGVTNLDRMTVLPEWQLCEAYHYPGDPADLDGFFEHQGSTVSAIRVPVDPTDLLNQERLTQLLMRMEPIFIPCEMHPDRFVEQISRLLGLPVALSSYGPTAQEKFLHGPLAEICATSTPAGIYAENQIPFRVNASVTTAGNI
jgi:adenylosuccinate synthase